MEDKPSSLRLALEASAAAHYKRLLLRNTKKKSNRTFKTKPKQSR